MRVAVVGASGRSGAATIARAQAAGAYVQADDPLSRLIAGTSRPTYRSGVDRAVWWHYSTTFDTVGRAAVDALANPAWIDHAVFITE